MLKRSRAPSLSPTRADPSSPPHLDTNPRLSLPKRCRIFGPVIDSVERRDSIAADDDEDDYEDDNYGDNTRDVPPPSGKVYEHVNHFLHSLHVEHKYRSRTTLSHSGPSLSHWQHISQPAGLLSPRDPPLPLSSPLSSPAKNDRWCKARQTAHDLPMEPREDDSGGCNHGSDTRCPADNLRADVSDDERIRVTQRYEDTNRLLGSLVLSRRHTLRSPSVDPE